jgi:nucleoside-diphosphate-sugar epimerase
MTLLVTGATGFLGQRIVARALERGHRVRAVVRPGRDLSGMPWAGKPGLDIVEIDLAAESAVGKLVGALAADDAGEVVVVHAAGAMAGDDATQQAETVEPTRRLLQAMRQAGSRRLVLLSSLSVYGYAALPDGAQLDETTPTEPDPADRDAYCRAKLEQEALALAAAQVDGFLVTALRPGMIFGPGRLWSARLGVAKGRLAILLGGNAALPVSHVEHCAAAVVFAAERKTVSSDVYAEPDAAGRLGAFEAINVIDDDRPTQRRYAALLRRHADGAPAVVFRLPWGAIRRIAQATALLGLLAPRMVSRLPGILRPASLHARIKPLRYSNHRLHDRLGWTAAVDCESAVAASARRKPSRDSV